MDEQPQSVYDKMIARYESGEIPWNHELPPPEILAIAEELPPGRMLDLGSGLGRASIYFAQRGWSVDGVDFVDLAVQRAGENAAAAGVTPRFFQGDITRLDFLEGPYDLVIDVGCAHSLSAEQWVVHYQALKRLVKTGGTYMIYGRLKRDDESWGLNEPSFLSQLRDGFNLQKVERGLTVMGNGDEFPSAWYWFTRQAGT